MCKSVYCVPVGACVSSVIPWLFDVFPPDICQMLVVDVRCLELWSGYLC